MEKFLDQFNLNPFQRLDFEAFVFRAADAMVEGYMGGSWESREINGVRILIIPGSEESVKLNNPEGFGSVTTDRLTASAAFTCCINNWFWNAKTSVLSEAANEAFHKAHFGLRDMVYADNATHGINTNDYHSFTD